MDVQAKLMTSEGGGILPSFRLPLRTLFADLVE